MSKLQIETNPSTNLNSNKGMRCTPQGFRYKEGSFFINQDGQYIFKKVWKPKEINPKAIVFISHGVHEHCLCYEETVAQPLVKAGFMVAAHDHIGHGQSEGERSMVKSFYHYVRDTLDHVECLIKETNQNLPLYILGHSMGGVISLLAALERPDLFRGVILSSIAYQADPNSVPVVARSAAKILSSLFPRLPLINLALEKHCSDPKVVERFYNDPYRYYGKLKAKSATQFIQTVMYLDGRVDELKLPILILHGTQDKLASPIGSQYIYDKIKVSDKELMFFDNCYHQIHWEPNGQKERFLNKIADWMTKRL